MNTFGEEGPYTPFNQNDNQYVPKASDLVGRARAAFIQKVYTVLSLQLLVTVIFSALSMSSQAFFLFQLQNTWLFWVCLIVTLFIEIYMFCSQGGRRHPTNMICLAIFTAAEAYIVSFICSITGQESGNSVVVLAAVYTLAITVACTIYAARTESDFTTQGGLMVVLTIALMMLGLVTMFTSSPFLTNLYCALGVVVFGLYLIIDTQMIVGGKTIELSLDQYAVGAMLLYIDIIQIFLYLLRLLGNNND